MNLDGTDATSVLAWDAAHWLVADVDELLGALDREATRMERVRRALRWRWHPDRNLDADAQTVFVSIERLFSEASVKLSDGYARGHPGRLPALELRGAHGQHYRFRHRFEFSTGDARGYCGEHRIAYVYPAGAGAIVGAFEHRVANLPFADAPMRAAMAAVLPGGCRRFAAPEGEVVVLAKPRDFVPLPVVVHMMQRPWRAQDVAWIVSSLLNLCCYLDYAGLGHQAVLPGNCLISPSGHGVLLAGGWGYASPVGDPLTALPSASAALAPPSYLLKREVSGHLDRYLLRALALDLLVEAGSTGIDGPTGRHVPAPMYEFLQLPPATTAAADYTRWQQALWQSFGERRFTPFALSVDDVYAQASTVY
ncbi:MAG: hypothetical protein AAF458_10180 [Pseudomonadota bacterium]